MPKFAILGHPVQHSKSPKLHQAVFDAFALADYSYEFYECSSEKLSDALKILKNGEFDGFSVTIPHKKEVLSFSDQLSDRVEKLGAANTLIRRGSGAIFAENTDYLGFQKALEEYDFPVSANGSWQSGSKDALVLGSGGAAQAVIAVLRDMGFQVSVASRSPKDEMLAYEDLDPEHDWGVIVNTTPLGMSHSGHEGKSALDDEAWFKAHRLYVDIIYTPLITPFLQKAKDAGAPVITGDRMFLWQAVEQSKLFMRKDDEESVEKIVQVMERVLSNEFLNKNQ